MAPLKRNKSKLDLSVTGSHADGMTAKRPCTTDVSSVGDLDDEDQSIVDTSNMVVRDDPPLSTRGPSDDPNCPDRNSLAKWVKYRNRWVLIPHWYFMTDRMHDEDCICPHCGILRAVERNT